MSREWAPEIRRPAAPLTELKQVAPAPQVVVNTPDPLPRPKLWRFVPLRGQDNLIVEVVATPEY